MFFKFLPVCSLLATTLVVLSMSMHTVSFPSNKWSRQILASKQRLSLSSLQCTPRVYRACWSIRSSCRIRDRGLRKGSRDRYMRHSRRRYITHRRSKRYTLTELLTIRPRVNCRICGYLQC